ncbi:MAG TPA: DUF1573 domain-containing protein [Phycisphaerales bacterium]|nr:DUF1573 domain-containing protein [Phycisphaerales bacterium]
MRTSSMALVVAAIALSGTLSAAAQDTKPAPTTEQQQPVKAPKMVLSHDVIDFGEIDDSRIVSETITITNAGDAPLKIGEMVPTCGCTAGKLEKDVLQPGESTELQLNFDPKRRSGAQKGKHLTINSNDPAGPQQVTLKIWVLPRVVADPAVVSFGLVQQGDTKTVQVRVKGMTEDFEVLDASIDREDAFSVKIVGHDVVEREQPRTGETIKVGESLLEVTLHGGTRIGRIDANLNVTTNDESSSDLSYRVTAGIAGDIVFAPTRVSLGALVPGQSFSHTFQVFSQKGRPFQIKKAILVTSTLGKEDRDRIKVTYEPAPEDDDKGGYMVTISGAATDSMRIIQGNIVLLTDAKGQKVVRAPVTGVVRVSNPSAGK